MRLTGISFLLALLLTVCTAAAQQPEAAPAPFARANVVLVQTTAPSDSVLQILRHYLTERGFLLDSVDAGRGLLTTTVAVPARTMAQQIKIRVCRLSAVWRLTALYTIEGPLNSATGFPAQYAGLEGAPNKTAFRLLEDVARAVPRGSLRYSRSKVRFGALTKLEDALKMPW
ncbi:hypothetical protein KLP40_01245 [Hymenobacter sp. NST-14]|uniref:hypothetical protein n=1 Tax=Hymenobacter piscis TaxID=2839984 RepID=UPI001C038325|nr:hypothetical protein [Hymenobacter piscis]MBT9391773.1 hypothetical protein [Hymenobacter piscis]